MKKLRHVTRGKGQPSGDARAGVSKSWKIYQIFILKGRQKLKLLLKNRDVQVTLRYRAND